MLDVVEALERRGVGVYFVDQMLNTRDDFFTTLAGLTRRWCLPRPTGAVDRSGRQLSLEAPDGARGSTVNGPDCDRPGNGECVACFRCDGTARSAYRLSTTTWGRPSKLRTRSGRRFRSENRSSTCLRNIHKHHPDNARGRTAGVDPY